MKYIYFVLPCLLLISSCGKFLEEYSQDQKYAQTVDDLNKLMVGEAFINSVSISVYSQATMQDLTSETGIIAPWLHLMDDDSEQFLLDFVAADQLSPLNMLSGFHNWSQVPNANVLNSSWEETTWRKIYKRIGALNAIIFQAENLTGEKDQTTLKHLQGEAYFLRAYYFFLLQNIYGAPYRVSSAGSDLGIPLKSSEKIEDNYFKRDNNEAVYKQIIADLDQAAKLLEGYNPGTKIRVGIAAVKTLQSRVYLYTEQYDKAVEATKDFEALGYSLIDLNQFAKGTNFTDRSSSESIFTMGSNVIHAVFMNDSISAWNGDDRRVSAFKASNDLISTYDTDDLRREGFFYKSAKSKAWIPGKYRTWNTYFDPAQVSCLFSFRYPEVILNRAEALAMMGMEGQAKEEIQKLRMRRFSNARADQIPQSTQGLVEFIRDERRRELCFEGHRWFDLRRYAVNSRFSLPATFKIKHPSYSYDAQSKTYTQIGNFVLNGFEQDAASWQVPIPNYTIEFNRGTLTNLIRTVRNVQPL